MKIYTKAVWQWQPDGTLKSVPEECESFEYEGPIAHYGGSGISSSDQNRLDPMGASMNAKNNQPQQPNYIGAANAQSAGTIGANMANNLMSHPDINTPLGSQTWNQTGSTPINIPGLGNIDIPQFSQNISLSPDQQNLYNQQTQLSSGLMGQAAQNLSQPSDLNSAQAINDKAYSAMTSRLDPQWQANQQQQQTQLANQGLVPGGEAYDNAMRVFNQSKNDAYQQAQLGAIQTMPQTQQMAIQARDQPLNEMNALRSGSQVNMPQFQPSQYAQGAQGPNTLGATQQAGSWQQAMYNQQMQQANANTSGLMGLGAAGMMAFA